MRALIKCVIFMVLGWVIVNCLGEFSLPGIAITFIAMCCITPSRSVRVESGPAHPSNMN